MKRLILSIILVVLLAAPAVVFAQDCNPGMAVGTSLCDALGVGTIPKLVERVFMFVGTVIATLAVLMIVYSGIRMVVSAGEPEALKTAKAGFTWAIAGLGVSALSFVLVLSVQKFIGVRPGGGIIPGQINNPLFADDAQEFMFTIVKNMVGLVGILASVMILYNVYLYIAAAGNEDQAKKAKSGMLWSVVGFVTAILAYVVITAVTNLLS